MGPAIEQTFLAMVYEADLTNRLLGDAVNAYLLYQESRFHLHAPRACDYCGRTKQTQKHRTCDGCGAPKRLETWAEIERRCSINIPDTMTPNPFYEGRRDAG